LERAETPADAQVALERLAATGLDFSRLVTNLGRAQFLARAKGDAGL